MRLLSTIGEEMRKAFPYIIIICLIAVIAWQELNEWGNRLVYQEMEQRRYDDALMLHASYVINAQMVINGEKEHYLDLLETTFQATFPELHANATNRSLADNVRHYIANFYITRGTQPNGELKALLGELTERDKPWERTLTHKDGKAVWGWADPDGIVNDEAAPHRD